MFRVKKELKKCNSIEDKLNKLIELQMNGIIKKTMNKDKILLFIAKHRT
jgi:hypothetical protein